MRDDPRRRLPAAYPFRLTMEPRFGDMDVNRHINNVAIARFYEEGRVRFHTALHEKPALNGARAFIAHIAIDYLAEARWPHPIEVGVGVVEVGGASYRLGLGLFQHQACIGLCESVLVNVGKEGSAPMSPQLRAALEELHLRAV